MARLKALLDRLIEREPGHLTPAHAQYLLSLGFPAEEQVRYEQLAVKAQQGLLSREDESELDDFLTINGLLMLLQSRVRRKRQQKRANASPC